MAGEAPAADPKKLNQKVALLAGMMTGAHVAAMIILGLRLGLYKSLAGAGPVTSEDIASAAGLHERWVREWLRGQAAAGILEYADGRFELSPEVALLLADGAGGPLRLEQVATRGGEEVQHVFVGPGRRVGHVHHHVDSGHGVGDTFAGEGVDTRTRRCRHRLMSLLGEHGDNLRPDQSGPADYQNLHEYAFRCCAMNWYFPAWPGPWVTGTLESP